MINAAEYNGESTTAVPAREDGARTGGYELGNWRIDSGFRVLELCSAPFADFHADRKVATPIAARIRSVSRERARDRQRGSASLGNLQLAVDRVVVLLILARV